MFANYSSLCSLHRPTRFCASRECHGSYSSQTHIKGDKPTKKSNFYGLGVSVISTCTIPFDC